MQWSLEVVILPVSDIDRAIAFYRDQVGFHLDHDTHNEHMHVVQLTPPGSGCSIVFGDLPAQNEMTAARSSASRTPTGTRGRSRRSKRAPPTRSSRTVTAGCANGPADSHVLALKPCPFRSRRDSPTLVRSLP
jgi:catechol 2,3-dioxygenase-like lactoylglutathione lyase family enzyme